MKERIELIQNKIYDAARKVKRDPEEITILGATKGVPVSLIEEAIQAGLTYFGENRVQEAETKIKTVKLPAIWHLIGHLQTNKINKALQLFTCIQSLDSLKLTTEIAKRTNNTIDCLLEVNTSGESTKHGFAPSDLPDVVKKISELPQLNLLGIMTLGPYPIEENISRAAFRLLRTKKEELEKELKIALPILSMGMSEDYQWAVMEGATMVRLGRAIFGGGSTSGKRCS